MPAMSSGKQTSYPRIEKVAIFGVGVSVTDYRAACEAIIAAATQRRSFAVSALAVHGLTEAADDPDFGRLVNEIDLVTPDGQPVRWAMNMLHRTGLRERVYGPDLTDLVCAAASEHGIGVYLFGSTPQTCEKMVAELRRRYPAIKIVGVQPDRFREATPDEDQDDVERINASNAGIVWVGLGCPRQERWVAEHRGRIDAAMLAVGAAFDYFAGNLQRPPAWAQRAGLEWLFRLIQEPRRLFGRYTATNIRFLYLLSRALLRDWAHRLC